MKKVTDKKKTMVILGAGGTGSWFASMISKVIEEKEEVLIIDGDLVEPKNTTRQNFSVEEVNQYKALAMEKRYGFSSYCEYIKDTTILKEHFLECGGVPLVVGCLDNNASRKIIHDLFHDEDLPDFIWVDSGNSERSGQTYIAMKENGTIIYPSPLDIDPVLAKIDESERRPDQISCAEMQESAPQNVTANVTAATILFDTVVIILNGGLLLGNKISWDTRTISVMKEEILG